MASDDASETQFGRDTTNQRDEARDVGSVTTRVWMCQASCAH